MEGRSVDEYRAPLFLAWQLTNRCRGRCITCCEESGPDRAWRDELGATRRSTSRGASLTSGIPYVAFGGGEPPRRPALLGNLRDPGGRGGVALKLETDGSRIDDAGRRPSRDARGPMRPDLGRRRDRGHARPRASRIELRRRHRRHRAPGRARSRAAVRVRSHPVQPARDRRRVRPGRDARLRRVRHGPADAPRPRGARLGCASPAATTTGSARSTRCASARGPQPGSMALSIYPWDIVTEMERRLESPQAMLLVVPNGKVKLLNALPVRAGRPAARFARRGMGRLSGRMADA